MIPKTVVWNEVYLIPLRDDGSPDVRHNYIYLVPNAKDPVTVRFVIEGTSSICRHGSLWVNIPELGQEFRREKFREFKLVPTFNRTIEFTIPIEHAGAYAFYTTYAELPPLSDSEETNELTAHSPTKRTETYYIDVAPRLSLDGDPLPLNALSIFSVISKFMGRYPDGWERHLQGISERGYNMVHFTPLQVRGASNSPYSIYDQLGWDPACFPNGEEDVQRLVDSLERNHTLLSLTDIVLNHTAHNSDWLKDHPEAGYNLVTAPWLESAYLLDDKLLELSGRLAELGLPTELKSEADLLKIMDAIKTEAIHDIRLWQFYVLDVDRDAAAAVAAWVAGKAELPAGSLPEGGLERLKNSSKKEQAAFLAKYGLRGNDRMGERHRRRVDPAVSAAVLTAVHGPYEESDEPQAAYGLTARQEAARQTMIALLDTINVPFYEEYDTEVKEILTQLFNRIKYVRLDKHGPRLGPINAKNPLIETYFTRLQRDERTAKFDDKELVLVNNGWVWAGNALIDNAGPKSRVYLLRLVIVWGDCVKLRYGDKPEDSPFLWEHMTKYARMLAKYFAGFRIDNCHSTPIHVAEHMLDEARCVRPNLYVVAELFTGSEDMDYLFVQRLGISSLIREAMQAWSTGELSRLVHMHGGRPIGSFNVDEISRPEARFPTSETASASGSSSAGVADGAVDDALVNGNGRAVVTREVIRRIRDQPVQALFMDCTHDNEMPAQKRDARDTLPNAALVSMCASATGSVMGYDEIYPKLVDLVHETRLYTSESSSGKPIKKGSCKNGIAGIKKLLNQIHWIMGKDGYDETHVHHEDQYITVHRVHPESRKGYFLIAHTAFPGYGNGNGAFSPTFLKGTRARHLGSWMLEVDASDETKADVLGDEKYLRGLPSRVVDLEGIRMDLRGDDTTIEVLDCFPPGSIALFETWIPDHSANLDSYITSGAKEAFAALDLIDLNFVLYRCEAEERDATNGRDGTYDIPGHGKLVYAGLQGWWSVLQEIIRDNNLAHPLCQNLRHGQWALDYTVGRLERACTPKAKDEAGLYYPRLEKPATWLRARFDAIRGKGVPSFLLPRYFGLVIRTAYMAAWDRALELMSPNIVRAQWFLQSLAMVSVQETGLVRSASLYPDRTVPSLAAGLPHFAVEWARCWGRDVFISLRGLYLGTGRFDEAREHIRAFASVLKHGMIPNLLSSGKAPRYNSRDSIWFFLQCIQDYVRLAPDGMALLQEKVKRRFLPYDDTWFTVDDERAYSKESTIEDIVQEAMQRHATGMRFREANAGPGLDSQMKDEGFNIEIHVDWENGFIFGGNQSNCGTWMDKMGESERAGTKGVPGTPRDGAAVEIIGLLYSTLAWLARLNSEGKYAYGGVKKADGTEISFSDWASLIKANFERCFWIPTTAADDAEFDLDPRLVNRRGIYKDLYRSGKPYEDYQLRCNYPIAMTVAPDLFTPARALRALCVADEVLLGPYGMATLDPQDLNYRPYYRNSVDSDDPATAKGRNYHQGPEWLWPRGFFLRALLKFDLARRSTAEGRVEAYQQVTRRLKGCKSMIRGWGGWAGLTELTQKGGELCEDSCPTQAWSAGCLIDVYMDAAEYQAKRMNVPVRALYTDASLYEAEREITIR